MIAILVDVHLASATYFNQVYQDAEAISLTETDLYYSVLHKHNVSDSLFERSFVYYASKPKDFEKMYRKVTNHLTEMEDKHRTRQNELLESEGSN